MLSNHANPRSEEETARLADIPKEVQLEDTDCPLECARSDEVVISGARDRLHGLRGVYRVVRCLHCGLMRTNPRPTPETIGYYYPSDYGPYHTARQKDPTPLQKIVNRIFEERRTVIPETLPGRALELGCASGNFLVELRRKGWDAKGIEYNAEAGLRARSAGFDVHIGQAELAPEPSKPYDFVAAWMVLEHLHDPIKVLRKLHAWTQPSATLGLSVPDCGSWEMRRFGAHWYPLHIPNHLYHFSRETLSKVLAHSGWTLKRVQNQRDIWTAYVSLNYMIEDKSALSRPARIALKAANTGFLHSKMARPLALAMAAIGQTGCMTIIAERK